MLNPDQVTPNVLSPSFPAVPANLNPVMTQRLTVSEAASRLPFGLFVIGRNDGALPAPSVRFTTGARVDPASVPVSHRGLDFAMQRGDAAHVLYVADQRYLALIEGSAGIIEDSLRRAPAFWATAKPATVSVRGQRVSGWYLESAPLKVTDDPKSGQLRQVPGPSWLLLPNVSGTAVLVMAQGYSETELLDLAARLERAS